jgi:SMC interacting uncharacterized protein involved in chromosome segregation
LHRIKEALQKSFANLANDFSQRLHVISQQLNLLEGPLETQQQQVQEIQSRIPALSDALGEVLKAETECTSANVEENDYTVFSHRDLEFELDQLKQSIVKKMAFIDNQVCPVPRIVLLGSNCIRTDRFTEYDQPDASAA